ncbi:MAG: transcriptional regulator [bacterium]|nr:transcriptional regulator [bacterium]
MNNYNKIITYAKENNGYITTKESEIINVNSIFLSNLVNDKRLERVGPGIYKLPEYPIDNFYILSKSSKNMCYSHATALYLHNMSDRIPLVYDITVPYNYSGNLLNNENVSLRYVKEDIFKLGMTDIKTINNLTVKCYDLERTLCDIIKDKNRMDKEIYSKALKEYARKKDKDVLKLIKYSKKLDVEEEVVELMEVLL